MGNAKICTSSQNKDNLRASTLFSETDELSFDVSISNIRGRNLTNVVL